MFTFQNEYRNPRINGSFFGRPHETREQADHAAEQELSMEKETVRVAVVRRLRWLGSVNR
jgi:hypothetical protein